MWTFNWRHTQHSKKGLCGCRLKKCVICLMDQIMVRKQFKFPFLYQSSPVCLRGHQGNPVFVVCGNKVAPKSSYPLRCLIKFRPSGLMWTLPKTFSHLNGRENTLFSLSRSAHAFDIVRRATFQHNKRLDPLLLLHTIASREFLFPWHRYAGSGGRSELPTLF